MLKTLHVVLAGVPEQNILAENHNTRLLKYLQFILVELTFFPSVAALCHTLPDSFPDEAVRFLSVSLSSFLISISGHNKRSL